jgi:hypothetical protein
LSSFPQSKRKTPLLVNFAARPQHVVAPVLPARLLLVNFAARPQHVVAPVLPARLLLVDFAALPKATALDAQNLSPAVTTFRGCEFVVKLKV